MKLSRYLAVGAALCAFVVKVQMAHASDEVATGSMPKSEGVSLDSSQQEQVNAIARQIYEKMKADSGGDPEKMQLLLKQFAANPQQLFQSMNSEQKKKIDSLSRSVMQKQGHAPSAAPKKVPTNNTTQ